MEEHKKDKIVIFVTHGSENPEKSSIAFVMANAAVAMESEVTVVLQSNGVLIAKKGCYEHIFAAGFDSLKKLVDTFVELGGKIIVCMPCLEERQITKEMLIDEAKPAKAGRVINECLEAKAVLNY